MASNITSMASPESVWQDCRVKVSPARFQLIKQVFMASERFRFARALAKELWCTEGQVKNLIDSRSELSTDLVCLLFPCIRSRKHQLALLKQVEPARVKKVSDAVRGLLCSRRSRSRDYNLDLSIPPDYALAEACLLVNAWESESARSAGRPDLSQSGNGEMIRNEAYNDTPFVYSKDCFGTMIPRPKGGHHRVAIGDGTSAISTDFWTELGRARFDRFASHLSVNEQ
eukprot:g22182.t1